ncbi:MULTISPECIES: hypothetical protein [unclassified Collinsella]|uniref:hypothetical protein n=1 Tax=unclassified Collinsella TaxID=2637548 RepID=UPI0013140ECB|nr:MULTISPECIES: hypothetical protein [unclassified Collinsella]
MGQFSEKQSDSFDANEFVTGGKFVCKTFTSRLHDPAAPSSSTAAANTMPASLPE